VSPTVAKSKAKPHRASPKRARRKPTAASASLVTRAAAERQLRTFIAKFEPKLQISLAAAANGVGLAFLQGTSLPDPHGVLQGSGRQNRFVRLESAATLARPEVAALIDAAIVRAKAFPAGGRGRLVVRSISAKQRARRRAGR
jgi:hypothetical protein